MFGEKIIIYILISLVVISGSIFGIMAIDNVKEKHQIIETQALLLNFNKPIEQTKDNFGKVMIERFIIPSKIESLCFVDLNNNKNIKELIKYPEIKDSVTNGINKNIFFIYPKNQITSAYNPYLKLKENTSLCLEINEKNLNLKFTGIGNGTMVEYIPIK